MSQRKERGTGGSLPRKEGPMNWKVVLRSYPVRQTAEVRESQDAKRKRELLRMLTIEERKGVDLDERIESEQEMQGIGLLRGTKEPTIFYNVSGEKAKGGLVVRAVIKTVRLYQSVSRRLAK